jgi:long-subunit acyl-CoA synthetase (AMP-forming)
MCQRAVASDFNDELDASDARETGNAWALERLYYWEKTNPGRVILTQPISNGATRDFTWAQVIDESRRMVAHLQSLRFSPGARIAILSKNTAHWLMSDFAIWLTGFVSVPLYPTLAAETIKQILEHSGARLLFIGKLDGWERMKPGIPAGVQCRIDPVTGEIQMRSPAMMLGYYKEPDLTKQAFTGDGWLRTGDKGAIDAEGNLTITGRMKDLFKTSKGKYVSPAPIEDKLAIHTAIDACCVTGANLAQPLGLVVLTVDAIKEGLRPGWAQYPRRLASGTSETRQ